jgi:hypothetical protein
MDIPVTCRAGAREAGSRVPRIARATIAALLLARALAFAQDVTEPALKAAFIYNFAKFTEWPADAVPPSEPFVMCVIGDADVGGELERTVKGRVLAGHRILVSIVPATGPQRPCHVLYVSGVPAEQAGQIVAALSNAPVLTISDIAGFTQRGGMAQFFFENSQLRFGIRGESATRARLRISSKLLTLAKRYD